MIRTVFAILLASATQSVADVSFLGPPIECVLGETCVIENYPDVAQSDGHRMIIAVRPKDTGRPQRQRTFALLGFDQMNEGRVA